MSTPAFLELRFPTNISYGAIGGQGWSTRVVTTDAGYEYRQQLWAQTRGKWTVGHNLRTATQWAQLVAFHRLVNGRTLGFRFQDWTDYTDNGAGTISQNASSQWQLTKVYSLTDLFSTTWNNNRLISKPQPGTVNFFLNGSPYTFVNSANDLDYTTGVCLAQAGTGDPVPGSGDVYTWTGQFDVPCRFDVDEPEMSYDIPTGVGWRGIPIIELRIAGQ